MKKRLTQKREKDVTDVATIRARVRPFAIPPIPEGLVRGRNAPIEAQSLAKALRLLVQARYERIDLEDDIIAQVFICSMVLRRLPRPWLCDFVIREIKPLMGVGEIMQFSLRSTVVVAEWLGGMKE